MKRNIVIASVAAAALIGGGAATAVAFGGSGASDTSSAAAASSTPRSSVSVPDDDVNEDAREAKAATVSAPQAAAAALKATPGTVTGIDLDQDRPGLVWEVDVLGKDNKWHEVTLDAGNAKVLNQRVEHEGDDDHGVARARAELKGASVGAVAAAEKAAASYGTVTSVDLDDDHRGSAVWEVETVTKDGKEHKLNVDPRSGKVSVAPRDGDADGDDD
ncbi:MULTISPECIES: PepSY domain-containing protein [Streptomyces]|uniref:PepSY domain-containing protein n=2 Tax=Streptomyces rimosus subsp. rimosus TaxID=132474 RepID=L8EQT1_STRR1|nr:MULTISPECIES: PepSY domain-containing protein [Streptomyces]KOG72187.1 peptidase M4 [Kitasatospora aureofaciens]MYT42368.1 peptidase M4 [Streptomyces sp. SID5471]KEF06399.1 peptidase M4 [Streptomyces rimosus]KEF21451.1 peptidase M4 [Streptomyces rimosus]KOT36328.1 peptidase M4 [Streptomyces sp. NRRL WC-3701]